MRLKRPEGINIIPFIDIMLVLLAIVLTVSTFISKQAMEIQVPNAQKSNPLPNKKHYEIAINDKNSFIANGKNITLKKLEEEILQLDKNVSIVLMADKNSSFGSFIGVIDILKQSKKEHISVEVKKE